VGDPKTPETIVFRERKIGKGFPVFIIAEAGTSHGGSLPKAKELVQAAAESGADCIKFQIVFAEEIIHPKTGLVALPGGNIPLFDRFKQVEKDIVFYREIKEYADKKNILFLATPFGLKSADILRRLTAGAVKIASPELNHYPLLKEVDKFGWPIIFSTGVSTLKDIENALAAVSSPAAILHCITAYPAPEEEYNLKVIPMLEEQFHVPAGISDHSLDPVLIPVVSTCIGSRILEKHITLDSRGSGLDDPIACTPEKFTAMYRGVRDAEKSGFSETLRMMEKEYGKKRIKTIQGKGHKELAPAEAENYRTTNRSVTAVRDIRKGEILTEANIALLRSEKNLIPGLPAEEYMDLLGKKAARNIPDGTGLSQQDIRA